MLKKLFYFCIVLIFYFLFGNQKTNAKEYCYLYVDNELYETVELPFYYYEINRITDLLGSMPSIDYTSTWTFIDSITKCELISKEIINPPFNLANAEVADFSYNQIGLLPYDHFSKSKISKDSSFLKGIATKTDEEPPIINGYKEKYITNIDKPIALQTLISYFSAYDNFDGNITDKLEIKYEEYTANINKLGIYPIILYVEDNSSNSTTITFYIEIIDTTPPTISGENNFISPLSSPLNIDNIIDKLIVSDNVDKSLKSNMLVAKDSFSLNKNNPGTYHIYFCVYDNSENISNEFEVIIKVVDDIPPILEGLDYFNSYLSSPLSIKEIMYSLAASDNGNDISNNIFVTEDYYSNYQNTLGEKTIYFKAMDTSNNISAPFKVTINLIDDISPQIFGLNMFTSYLSNPLSITYLKQQLSAIDNFEGNITNKLEIINDSYSNNINKKGTFHITFQIKDSSLNNSEEFPITITNIDDIPPYIEGPSSLKYKLENKPSLQTILGEFFATDNIDENINIQVINEDYSSSIQTGFFYIQLSCEDEEGNISAPFITTIEIVDEMLETNEVTLILPTTYLYSLDEINSLINLNKTYSLIENTYSSNFNKEGTYSIVYKLEPNIQLKITITTFIPDLGKTESKTQPQLTNTQKKETFLTKIKSFFCKIFSSIKSFLKKLFL